MCRNNAFRPHQQGGRQFNNDNQFRAAQFAAVKTPIPAAYSGVQNLATRPSIFNGLQMRSVFWII